MTEHQTMPPAPAPETIPVVAAGPSSPRRDRRTIWVPVATAAAGLVGGFLIGNASGGSDSAANSTTTTTILTTSSFKEAFQRCADTETGDSASTSIECGVTLTVFDDGGIELQYFPTLDFDGNGGRVIDDVGHITGCWSSTDRSKMGQTRALDGRVESSNGRSSWTYHPDDGMNIICDAATQTVATSP